MLLFIVPVLLWLRNRGKEYLDFLRSIPSLLAPKPTPLSSYIPPFIGGQCEAAYRVSAQVTLQSGVVVIPSQVVDIGGRIGSVSVTVGNGGTRVNIGVTLYSNGQFVSNVATFSEDLAVSAIPLIARQDGQPDNCGNLPNPTAPPSIADDGLFTPSNPSIGDENGTVNPAAIVLSPALPLVLVAAITGGYMAAMAAAKAASDALEAIKKVAEGLEALKKLWDKLQEFLDEWEKNRPKKRDLVRQTYGQILGDGALDFFPDNNTKFQAIQLDVIITNIPVGFGKYFGSLSPSRYRYRELGYIAFYSVNQGILEVHSLQFKRTTLQIPPLAVGFIYHFGLDNQIKAFAFGTFSIEKS